MSTKLDSTCLSRAAEDEPIFVLRAQDVTAPDTIAKWLELNSPRLGDTHPKIVAATRTMREMPAWPTRKLPD